MRVQFPVAPRFTVWIPWWLAGFAYVVWLTAALICWIGLVCVVGVIYAGRLIARGWAARRPAA